MKKINMKSISKLSITKTLLATAVVLSMQACTTKVVGTGSSNQEVVNKPSDNKGSSAKISKLIVRSNVPMPRVTISNTKYMITKIIPVSLYGSQTINISEIDDFITQVSPNARHYPPNFPNRTQRYNVRSHLKKYVSWIQQFAEQESASYEVLILAAQLNGMARNLDMGSDYAVRGQKYVDRALEINQNSIEANLLYGFMLTEGGAFETGVKYLNQAVALGSAEAEQCLAQTDLINDNRPSALARLQALQANNPNNAQLTQQIAIVNEGKYYIWDLPANDINVKYLP